MKTKLLLVLCALLPLPAIAITESTKTYTTTAKVFDATIVDTSGAVIVSNTANVTYGSDTRVRLNAGFKVNVGGLFRSRVEPDIDGDGMTNAWEVTYGLDPLTTDGTGDADSDGVSNLLEFKLGTNPNTTKQADSGNQPEIKIHKPN